MALVSAVTVPAGAALHPGGGVRHVTTVASGVISTVAGGVGGPGPAAQVAVTACALAFGGGHLYIGDGGSVRQVSPRTDQLTTTVGTGVDGPPGDGGPATQASVGVSGGLTAVGACGLAFDHSGNLVIEGSTRIRVVAASAGTFYGQAMTKGTSIPWPATAPSGSPATAARPLAPNLSAGAESGWTPRAIW
jgi:hypothetical protein